MSHPWCYWRRFLRTRYTALLPAVSINEFMALERSGVSLIVDFEDFPDWIELKNNSSTPVSLDGYFLSDSSSNPLKWAFPPGISIPGTAFCWMADLTTQLQGRAFPRLLAVEEFRDGKVPREFQSLSAAGETLNLTRATGIGFFSLINASSPSPVPPANVAVWKFKDDGSDQGSDWRKPGFNDSVWPSGRARLGYGDPGEGTTISYGFWAATSTSQPISATTSRWIIRSRITR